MSSFSKLLSTSALLALTLSGCATTATQTAPMTSAPVAAATPAPGQNAWGFATNDLTQDPAVRMGVLPNGMKYAVMRNETPKGGASFRMFVKAGYLNEDLSNRGVAHFIEHLALNETQAFPEGTLIKHLEKLGLSFGADTNAHTFFTETVYKLDVPNATTDVLDQAMLIMRETTGRATFSQATVDRERGIIMAERRARDTPDEAATIDHFGFMMRGTNMGWTYKMNDQVIRDLTTEQIRDFYLRYYRPENAVLTVVGDFDPVAMEQKLKDQFSDWKGTGKPGAPFNFGALDYNRPTELKYHRHPALRNAVTFERYQPYQYEADSTARRLAAQQRLIGDVIINRRLATLVSAKNSPISGGGMGTAESVFELTTQSSLTLSAKDGQLAAALELGEQELRRALTHGFTQGEVDEAVAILEGNIKTSVEQAGARRHESLSTALYETAQSGHIFTTPAANLAIFQANKASFTPAAIHSTWKAAWQGNPVIFVRGKDALTTEQLTARLADSQKVAVTPPVDKQVAAFAYTDFGKAGAIASDTRIDDLGIRTIRFANNVRLNIKRTTTEPGRVHYSVRVAGGQLVMPKTKPGLALFMGAAGVRGGLAAHSYDDLRKLTAGKQVSIPTLNVGDDAFVMGGATTPADLLFQLQLAGATITAPGYRDEADTRWQALVAPFDANAKSQAMTVAGRNADQYAADGDPRFGIPTLDVLQARNMAEVKAVMTPVLANAPIEIGLVGDIDEAAAIAAVASTFGAMPNRQAVAPNYAGARQVRFPAKPGLINLTHNGNPEQAATIIMWKATDSRDAVVATRINLLAEVMGILVLDEVRERMGATYSPQVGASVGDTYPGYGVIQGVATASGENVDQIIAAFEAVAKQLRDAPVTNEVLDRARTPLLAKLRKADQENGAWIALVDEAQSKPGDLDDWRRRVALVEGVTAADLQAAAQLYLREPALKIRVVGAAK